MAEDLKTSSTLYQALIMPDDPIWEGYSQSVRNNLVTLKALNATQCFPVLMAAYSKLDRGDFEKIVWLMTTMAVRYSLICSFRTGALEIKYAETARDISAGKAKRAGAVFRLLNELYPSDQTFSAAFQGYQTGSAKHARFLLRKLEIQHSGGVAQTMWVEALFLPTAYLALMQLLGMPKPVTFELWHGQADEATVLSSSMQAERGHLSVAAATRRARAARLCAALKTGR